MLIRNVLKLVQKVSGSEKRELYITFLPVEDIINLVQTIPPSIKADIWSIDNVEGYQRRPDQGRARSIKDFLIKSPLQEVFPLMLQPVILNVRSGSIKFVAPDAGRTGELELKADALTLYEVDGQHRIEGLVEAAKEAKWIAHFEIPLVITRLEKQEEAFQFVVINTKQKRVPPDLTLRVLGRRYTKYKDAVEKILGERKIWQIDAQIIADKLSMNQYSVWYQQIAPPGRRGRQKYIISEQSFVNSLESVLKPTNRLISSSANQISKFLMVLWSAMKRLFPESFNPQIRHEYLIQKTLGTNTLHLFANFAYLMIQAKDCNPDSEEDVAKLLDPLEALGANHWISKGPLSGYGGKSGAAKEAEEFVKILLKNIYKEPKTLSVNPGTHAYDMSNLAKQISCVHKFKPFKEKYIDEIRGKACGVYILLRLKGQEPGFYVGRAHQSDLKTRVDAHRDEDYDIFNWTTVRTPEDSAILESALYHILSDSHLLNRQHPSRFQGKACPYCDK